MKYFIDTEFLEGTQTKRFLGINYGKTAPTIELISIGIINEAGKTFYAVSKDFNLEEAWWRSQDCLNLELGGVRKEYRIRENVLKPIFDQFYPTNLANIHHCPEFNYKNMKSVIKHIGCSKQEIVQGIMRYLDYPWDCMDKKATFDFKNTEFYGYYADYNRVVFCRLRGQMKDLPEGFPHYCKDLKQMVDEIDLETINYRDFLTPGWLSRIEDHPDWPKQKLEHHALEDARRNLELYRFIELIK